MKRPEKAKNILDVVSRAIRAGHLLYSTHANNRMRERGIIKPDVERVLIHGHHEARKDQFSEEFGAWDYAIRGKTLDGRNLRIVIALGEPNVLVVTAIDLDAKEE